MWQKLGEIVLRYRLALLLIVLGATAFMTYEASKVKLSYEFVRAIPTDNPLYQQYLAFKQKFGEDGNMLAIGFQTDQIFQKDKFNAFAKLHQELKKINGVEDVLSVASAINLIKNDSTEKLFAAPIFPLQAESQAQLDSAKNIFLNLPFYRGLLYNPETHTFLLGVKIQRQIMESKARETVVKQITDLAYAFGTKENLEIHLSGLPLIRTDIAVRIANEMKWFLFGSIIFSAFILLLFFRSVSTMILSLSVVIIGVIWSMGVMHLLGYKITLLTALIPPLIVVIGIPNCIYFLNKYHTSWLTKENKNAALVEMVSRMGIVTLFCNIAAAIGFAVFALTKSAVLKEFGVVAGINIMVIFFISFILIPVSLSYLPAPKSRHVKYLESKWLDAVLTRIELWVFNHKKTIYTVTVLAIIFSVLGIMRLKSEGFIVDDLPKTDKIYSDLKFFEKNFKGIMPLEILIDTKKKYGFSGTRALDIFQKMDSLSTYIASKPEMARPLSLVEGLKFAKQGFFDGDTNNYALPTNFVEGAFLSDYLKTKKDTAASKNSFQKLMAAFMDSNKQVTRVSVNMADVGSKRLPEILTDLKAKSNQLFDSTKFNIQFTGTSITFLEGSRFIINGLKESIMWAFLLIALCMLYLFRSFRILICSLIPNLIPLLITAGIMGWVGVRIKPSTVLVFSVALGIAIDITIRFLVNYKQELPVRNNDIKSTVLQTIHHTGISIIYTSLVLIAGFIIFVFSGFGGTKALGWLTSLTLLSATVTNLVLLPILLLSVHKVKPKKTA
ncbi:MAG: RND transporter [Bacteroidetes bacterium]|nr:MAG: RND transporter [Bacteroidota bacterium]